MLIKKIKKSLCGFFKLGSKEKKVNDATVLFFVYFTVGYGLLLEHPTKKGTAEKINI